MTRNYFQAPLTLEIFPVQTNRKAFEDPSTLKFVIETNCYYINVINSNISNINVKYFLILLTNISSAFIKRL